MLQGVIISPMTKEDKPRHVVLARNTGFLYNLSLTTGVRQDVDKRV